MRQPTEATANAARQLSKEFQGQFDHDYVFVEAPSKRETWKARAQVAQRHYLAHVEMAATLLLRHTLEIAPAVIPRKHVGPEETDPKIIAWEAHIEEGSLIDAIESLATGKEPAWKRERDEAKTKTKKGGKK